MDKKADITAVKKGFILARICGNRHNYQEIAWLKGVSVSIVFTYAKNTHGKKNDLPSLHRRLGWWLFLPSKCKCKIALKINRIVVQKSLEDPKATFKKVQTNLEANGIMLSIQTLKRWCAEIGLNCSQKGQNSSETMKKIHLNFVKQYKIFLVASWKKVSTWMKGNFKVFATTNTCWHQFRLI